MAITPLDVTVFPALPQATPSTLWSCFIGHPCPYLAFPGGSVAKNLPAMQDLQETRIRSLGREDSLEEDMATQYSCLANPTDRGAWWATVLRVTQSWIWLKRLSTHTCTRCSPNLDLHPNASRCPSLLFPFLGLSPHLSPASQRKTKNTSKKKAHSSSVLKEGNS